MPEAISPHLVNLTYDAAVKSFWYKDTLRRFLRSCSISENYISSWGSEEKKRNFLDRVFTELQKSTEGKAAIRKMALSLADQTTFPDFKSLEDFERRNSEAAKAVKDLKYYLERQQEQYNAEKNRAELQKVAKDKLKQVQRTKADKGNLKKRLEELYKGLGEQKTGYAFQEWFYDLLDFCEIVNRRPYIIDGRQIDGSLTHDGTTYLVELKFTAQQSDATDIDSLRAKVDDKADNTMGIMVSISGYSSVAIRGASGRKTTLVLMDAGHLYLFLSEIMDFTNIIARLRRHVSQTGEAYLAPGSFN
ncbi:MAG TPA: hypothetical protein VFT64_01950 [Rickettsiales bacterium]|nr:hypothetical protein [Rickettsiales bacterium]